MQSKGEIHILFIGDVIGKPGRKALKTKLSELSTRYQVDLIVVNGENAAGGIGITKKVAEELFSMGVDVITSGNHIWRKKEILSYLEDNYNILRPANYPPGTPGRGWGVYTSESGHKVGILNLEGRTFMKPLECPFRLASKELGAIQKMTSIILVDFHAEATSEKIAMGWYLDGKVSAVIGTHTHVQTADERILPNGTGYITDAGMTGPMDSVIGMRKDIIMERFLTLRPQRFQVAKKNVEIQGVFLKVDSSSGKAIYIERVKDPVKL